MPSHLYIATAVGITALSPLIYSQQANQQCPNIVYIMSDYHAYQAISAYGGLLDWRKEHSIIMNTPDHIW
jgi:hypothetical protein